MEQAAGSRMTKRSYEPPHDTPLPYEPPAPTAEHVQRLAQESGAQKGGVAGFIFGAGPSEGQHGAHSGGAAGFSFDARPSVGPCDAAQEGIGAVMSPIAPAWGQGEGQGLGQILKFAGDSAGAGPSDGVWPRHRRESYRLPPEEEGPGNQEGGVGVTPEAGLEVGGLLNGGPPDNPPRLNLKTLKRRERKRKRAAGEEQRRGREAKRAGREEKGPFTGNKVSWVVPPPATLDAQGPLADMPILLFDLNGTLTSHTFQRQSAGQNNMRPGTPHLRRLKERFRLGVYTSSSLRTVQEVVPMLEKAAGEGPPLFDDQSLVLHRSYTQDAPPEHKAASGKAWDTIKPLARYFSKLHRVLLVDDDAFKAIPGEELNMVLVPRWNEEPTDATIQRLVDALMRATDGLEPATDLRAFSRAVSGCLLVPKSDAGKPPVPVRPPFDPNEIALEAGEDSEGDDAGPEEGSRPDPLQFWNGLGKASEGTTQMAEAGGESGTPGVSQGPGSDNGKGREVKPEAPVSNGLCQGREGEGARMAPLEQATFA